IITTNGERHAAGKVDKQDLPRRRDQVCGVTLLIRNVDLIGAIRAPNRHHAREEKLRAPAEVVNEGRVTAEHVRVDPDEPMDEARRVLRGDVQKAVYKRYDVSGV